MIWAFIWENTISKGMLNETFMNIEEIVVKKRHLLTISASTHLSNPNLKPP